MKKVIFSTLLLSVMAIAAPENPGNLRLVPGATTVDISWQDNSENESGFKILRDGKLIHITHTDETHFIDTGLKPGTQYHYTVKATDDMEFSGLEYRLSDKSLIVHGRFTPHSHLSIYIDADNNPNTGYSGKHSAIKGADYLIQDSQGGTVFKYPQDATGWKWNKIGSTSFQRGSTTATAKIPQNLIALGDNFKFLASFTTRDWVHTTYSEVNEIGGDERAIGANALKITFAKTANGVILESMSSNGRELLQNAISLFDLSIAKIDELGSPLSLKADSGWQSTTLSKDGKRATLSWSHPLNSNLPASLTVVATVEIDNGKAKWDLKVEGLGAHHTLMDSTFPQFDIKADGNDHLFVPFRFGAVLDNPKENARDQGTHHVDRHEGSIYQNNDVQVNEHFDAIYPMGWGAVMQYMAYYNDSYGLYFGIHDPKANIKHLKADSQNGALRIEVMVPAPNKTKAGNDWEFPGEFETDIFQGDWYDAAMIYKRWVYANADYRPPVNLREGTKKLKDIDIWGVQDINGDVEYHKSRGHENINERLKNAILSMEGNITTQNPNVDFAIYWLSIHGQTNEFNLPKLYPSGETKYLASEMLKRHISDMFYTNGYIYSDLIEVPDDTVVPFSEVEEYAVHDVNGHLINQRWAEHQFHPMCPTQKKWQDILVKVHKNNLSKLQTSGVFIDQITAAKPIECFGDHGHPLGGGHYWRDGYKKLVDRIKALYPADTFFMAESFNDSLMDTLDGYETIIPWYFIYNYDQYPHTHMVPAIQTVYGSKATFVGPVVGTGYYNKNDFYGLNAYTFAMGNTMGYYYTHVTSNAQPRNYLRRLTNLREKLQSYITEGQMQRPIEVVGNIPTEIVETSKRVDQQHRAFFDMKIPVLQRRAWKSKDGKSVAFVFINGQEPGRQALNFSFSIDGARYGLHGNLKLKRITENSEDEIEINGNSQSVALNAADAVAYILSEE